MTKVVISKLNFCHKEEILFFLPDRTSEKASWHIFDT